MKLNISENRARKTEVLSSLTKSDSTIEDYLYLTFDFDWAAEEVLEFVFSYLKERSLKATFFVTHKSQVAQQFYGDEDFEFGIHPNFNFLLSGDFRYGATMTEVLDYYETLLPFKSYGMRSHDSFFKTSLIRELARRGYRYESNILLNRSLTLRPFKNWSDEILQIPMLWEDDQWCANGNQAKPKDMLAYKHLKVLNFHPIHLYLNSRSLEIYEAVKDNQDDIELLLSVRNKDKFGVRNFLDELTTHL
jgi:hypothetical protein